MVTAKQDLATGTRRTDAVGGLTMVVLGVGLLGIQVFWAFNTGTMPLFLKGYTSSKFYISLILSLAGISACVVGPLIGYLSDRTSVRFGRRAPYIVGGMSAAALCLLALPHAGGFAAVAAVAVVLYCAVGTAQTPYYSLLPDVTPPEQRGTASGVMNLLGSFGIIGYFAVSAALWEAHPRLVFALVAAVGLAVVLVPVAFIREPAAAPPPASAGLRAHLRSVRRETPVLMYFVASSCCWLGHWIAVSFFTLFVVEELGVSEGPSQYVPMVFGLSATLATLPLGILGDRIGRKRLLTWMVVLWALVGVGLTFAQTFVHALVAAALTGVPFAALITVGYALMLDLIPRARTAEFLGLSVIPVAVPQVIGPILGGVLIDTFGYRSIFPTAAGAQVLALLLLRYVPGRPPGRASGT
jgi:MFS family permease